MSRIRVADVRPSKSTEFRFLGVLKLLRENSQPYLPNSRDRASTFAQSLFLSWTKWRPSAEEAEAGGALEVSQG